MTIERIIEIKTTSEEWSRSRADNGEDYSMPSVMGAVATRHTPQRLLAHWILITGVPRLKSHYTIAHCTINFKCPFHNEQFMNHCVFLIIYYCKIENHIKLIFGIKSI